MELAQLQAVYQELSRAVEARVQNVRGLQQRAATGAAATGILLGLLASERSARPAYIWLVSLLAIVILLAGLYCAAKALWPRRLQIRWPLLPPASGELFTVEAYLAPSPNDLLGGFCQQLFDQLYSSELQETEADVERWVRRQALCLGGGFGLVLLIAIAVTLTNAGIRL
ncbi:MAG: hypothetical protein M3072_04895 [Candidatus Dormibacteraeota bacterium]|nr:hypothetical protein [Candidatus Dormibacteraeota bacterium]